MSARLKEGDPVRVMDQVKRKEATGHILYPEPHQHYNPATKRSSRRTWWWVLLENGEKRLYTPAQIKKLRRRKA